MIDACLTLVHFKDLVTRRHAWPWQLGFAGGRRVGLVYAGEPKILLMARARSRSLVVTVLLAS